MIHEILHKQPSWFEQVLDAIVSSELSNKKNSSDLFKVSIDAEFYIHNLCSPRSEGKWHDWLRWIFLDLKELWVIEDYKAKSYTKAEEDAYDIFDLMSDLYSDPETGDPTEDAPWDQGNLYLENWWPYYVKCNKEKVRLFSDIIFKRKRYVCGVWMIKFLMRWHTSFDLDAFLDFMRLDDTFVFHDWEVLLYAIASSTRKDLAKMYYYFARSHDENQRKQFEWELELENEVVMDNTQFHYPDTYKGYYFNSALDQSDNPGAGKDVTSWLVKYDPKTKVMQMWEKNIPFKWAKLQTNLIEYLIEHRIRSVSEDEIKQIGIKNLKVTIDDIKKKLKKYGASSKECKDLFNIFDDERKKYCRILL